MRRATDSIVAVGLIIAALAMGGSPASAEPQTKRRVLVVNVPDVNHPTSGPAGVAAVREFAALDDYDVDACTDYGVFTDQYLAPYDAMVWVMAAPLTWTDASRAAFETFVKSGKGSVGLHVAALTGISKTPWTWFEDYVGGLVFTGHPARQTATVRLDPAATGHPVLQGVDPVFRVWDEWYSWNRSPRARQTLTVVATLDEGSYDVGKLAMGDHPIAWVGQPYGRMMVAGFGHDPSVYRDPNVRRLLRNAILWVMTRPAAR
jgi:chitinase